MSKGKLSSNMPGNEVVIRVQSPIGTKRVSVKRTSTTGDLFKKIADAFRFNRIEEFQVFRDRHRAQELREDQLHLNLAHGDMVFVVPRNGVAMGDLSASSSSSSLAAMDTGGASPADTPAPSPGPPPGAAPLPPSPVGREDEVDQTLKNLDGKVSRGKDAKYCQHGRHSQCVHCTPLDPWDERVLEQFKIKHISFHSYLKKLTSGIDRGKFASLEDTRCSIKSGCSKHPPWPRGICSKCQPSAVILQRQFYRHVDNVMFENAHLADRFLHFWRVTGNQRMGIMYGRYEVFKEVPLGIKAVVCAIYEPPQKNFEHFLELDESPGEQELVDQVAAALGLCVVGWIFTDLLPADLQKGTVKHFRNFKTHFLSAHECIMAARMQNKYPNPCSLSSSGVFGSRIVTVCCTGDSNRQIHMEGYQVSNQCTAMVRDDILVPTWDRPELAYVRESTEKQYVPDVYYKQKDEYGNEVTKIGRPLPVDYLLVDVPCAQPRIEQEASEFTFFVREGVQPFPVENRSLEGHIQDFAALAAYLPQFPDPKQALDAFSDFHLLLYILQMETLPMREYMGPLLEAVRKKDRQAAMDWHHSEHWQTVCEIVNAATAPSAPTRQVDASSLTPSGSSSESWDCSHCTFINSGVLDACEMCGQARL